MMRKLLAVQIIAILLVITGLYFLYASRISNGINLLPCPNVHERNDPLLDEDLKKIQHQRNVLSAAMIRLSQEFHQYECKMMPKKISSHGGWCVQDANETGQQHRTDNKLIPSLIQLFEGKTVASFGEGPGMYKKFIDESKKIVAYDGFDGSPFCNTSTKGAVNYLDLSIPVFGYKIYDWVISLEVGEHIPTIFEDIFLDNVANHAGEGIVLSWGVPGQKGHGHVNGKTLKSVIGALNKRGFSHDRDYSLKLQNSSSLPWLRKNINVYRRNTFYPANPLWA